MQTFQKTREHAEQEKLLVLMNRIESEPAISQRALASELGVALGLMNTYLKRCVKKGWIKTSRVSGKSLAYMLTPEGFVEKSRIVGGYLSKSFTLFRDAKKQCESFFSVCKEMGWIRVAVVGEGDLTDIALLVGKAEGLIIENSTTENDLSIYDAILITDMEASQAVYDYLSPRVDTSRLLVLDLLHVSKRNVS
jgi:hypothetical protein